MRATYFNQRITQLITIIEKAHKAGLNWNCANYNNKFRSPQGFYRNAVLAFKIIRLFYLLLGCVAVKFVELIKLLMRFESFYFISSYVHDDITNYVFEW